MKIRTTMSASGVLLATAFATAGDTPKLVPRPVPGLMDELRAEKSSNEDALALLDAAVSNKPAPPIKDVPSDAGASFGETGSTGSGSKVATKVPPASPPSGAEANAPARILFIHRRASLPPQLTADLAKPQARQQGQKGVSSRIVPARPGKVRIIPKSDVATLLSPQPSPKPSEP